MHSSASWKAVIGLFKSQKDQGLSAKRCPEGQKLYHGPPSMSVTQPIWPPHSVSGPGLVQPGPKWQALFFKPIHIHPLIVLKTPIICVLRIFLWHRLFEPAKINIFETGQIMNRISQFKWQLEWPGWCNICQIRTLNGLSIKWTQSLMLIWKEITAWRAWYTVFVWSEWNYG